MKPTNEAWERFKVFRCRFCGRAVRYDKVADKTLELIGDELHTPNCPRKQAHHKDRGFYSAQKKRDAK